MSSTLHVFFDDCTHYHSFDDTLDHHTGDNQLTALSTTGDLLISSDCHWGDFTSPEVDALVLYDFPSFVEFHSTIQHSYYKSLLFALGKSIHSLRGPPSIS